ncbi:thioredoxin-like protein [Ampelomyces quisqualis]|uniref:Thioredoxin-like protein n=1 Tax=Ampelomyces quisqualis TaxID=50730 RepID=A0A6A5QS41_AMPQU|nr:thioredoxin-like protein [Ampelomyces quisqualis]
MVYVSIITFTLDTICPWTYIAYLRLSHALATYRETNPSSPTTFILRIAPYQLYPDFSPAGKSKYEWHLTEKYHGDTDRMDKYMAYMSALGLDEGIALNFKKGVTANTLHAHRVLHILQEEYSPSHALLALESLYQQYFALGAHPSSPSTLLTACDAAGLGAEDARAMVEDEDRGMKGVQMAIREQTGNAVDSVPYVVFEGRRRDFTEVGAKTVDEYRKVLGQVEKEAS